MEQLDHWPDLMECPSSPFDHHASFIAFPFATRRQYQTGTIDRSETINSAPIRMAFTQVGTQQLAQSMGYRVQNVHDREAQLIRADALTYIEKLTLGQPMTKRPRGMHPVEVRVKLQKIIPERYFMRCKKLKGEYKGEDWLCSEDVLVKAAAKYITVLKIEKGNSEAVTTEENGVKASYPRARNKDSTGNGEQAVERTLTKIHRWCDKWLDGEIAEADWDKMEECLELST